MMGMETREMSRMKSGVCVLFLCLFSLSCFAASEFEMALNSYGKLRTAAGRGLIRGGGVNGWMPSMEGGNALDAELSRPHAAMADLEGNLYIADKDGHAIRKVTPDGTIHTVAGTGEAGYNGDGAGVATQLNQPNGVYTFPDGTTYILDLGNNRIRKLTTSGDIVTVLEDPDGIGVGRGLWVSKDETVIYYVSYGITGLIRKWTPVEGLTTYASGFSEPGNIDVDPTDGNVVITDRGANTVYRVFFDGSKVGIAGNGETTGGGDGEGALETALHGVRGICFAPNGGYYLATHEGGQVWYVDTQGIIHLLIDGDDNYTHAGDGEDLKTPGLKISEPRAVALGPNGDLIVTENDYGYVRVVERVFVVVEALRDSEGDLTLTWSSLPGMMNAIEYKGGLEEASWQTLTEVPARNEDIVTSYTLTPTAGTTQGYYRIGVVE
jgi:sugar lactone lactonase YvrE